MAKPIESQTLGDAPRDELEISHWKMEPPRGLRFVAIERGCKKPELSGGSVQRAVSFSLGEKRRDVVPHSDSLPSGFDRSGA